MMPTMYIREPNAKERSALRKYEVIGGIAVAAILGAAALVIWSGGILAWQSVQWLNSGIWPALTWVDGFAWLGVDYPIVRGIGTQKIVDWFMSLGLWTLPLLTGIVVLWVSGTINGNAHDKTADARRVDLAWKRHLEEKRKENPQNPEGN
jgi:hypothetical protein